MTPFGVTGRERVNATALFLQALGNCVISERNVVLETDIRLTSTGCAAVDTIATASPETKALSIFDCYKQPSITATETLESVYLNSPTEVSIQPVIFWKSKGHEFMKFKMLARKYLSIPASSGSVERLFSASGALMRARRNRLTPTTVEALLLAKETGHFEDTNIDD